MEDIRLALMSGVDIPIPQCQLILHQPKIKEISLIGERDFFIGVQCLNINKNMYLEDESLLQDLSNFQIFMKVLSDKRASDKKKNVIQVFSLILPNYQIAFLPSSLILKKDNQVITIDDNNFELFQNYLAQIFCLKSELSFGSFNPGGKKAKEIADKLNKARQRVAADKGEGDSSTLVTYMSCLSIALQIPVTQFADYTLFQLYDSLERYGLYTAWDIDLRVRLAGGDPKEKQENWMKSIH